jgi:CRISPR-associated protein Csy3
MAKIIPALLSFNRSLSPGEGLMYSTANGEVIGPVTVIDKTVRGAIGSYGNVYTDAGDTDEGKVKKAKDPEAANIQRIDVAVLPAEADGFEVRYPLLVQGAGLAPVSCNDEEYRQDIVKAATLYAEAGGYAFLADRYAWNIVTGRALWRNRIARNIKITVTLQSGKVLTFDPAGIPLFRFPGRDAMPEGFAELSAEIARGLASPTPEAVPLWIKMSGTLPPQSEVYPSQEFVGDGRGDSRKKGDKSKTLSSIRTVYQGEPVRQATIHSQKIGNALRTIDEWHGQAEEFGAIAAEPFGYVQERSVALRLPARKERTSSAPDLYALLMRVDEIVTELEKSDATGISDDIHYLFAVIARGGVFSGGKKKDAEKTGGGRGKGARANVEAGAEVVE